MPHLGEELWQRLGATTMLVEQPWPEADAGLLVDDSVTMAVQVNGKLRATIALPRDAEDTLAQQSALEQPAVQRAMGDKEPRRVIVVRNKIVNVVI